MMKFILNILDIPYFWFVFFAYFSAFILILYIYIDTQILLRKSRKNNNKE
ncbi:MAG: hypothetical protein CFH21_00242 [Alphaproteobacteria bacterium MarineAlpha5_Bin11]|nr:MAG: hypothetical protein CFH21_00242 [Alphaproteobacteria bacterium MarineAlpha5_Bin11]PPR51204.1 MAG: hypothetical protein CFH20_00732 [Alphaproteobacteria bacterium MarineAlpha5_Bin10]